MTSESKILFLDMDGVLNSTRFFRDTEAWRKADAERSRLRYCAQMIDAAAVVHLNRIIELEAPRVVLSSSWRLGFDLGIVERALQWRGFVGSLKDKTGYSAVGDSTNRRGLEIQAWLEAHAAGPATRIAILDDSADMGHLLPCLVRTELEFGLQAEHVDRVIELYNRGVP